MKVDLKGKIPFMCTALAYTLLAEVHSTCFLLAEVHSTCL